MADIITVYKTLSGAVYVQIGDALFRNGDLRKTPITGSTPCNKRIDVRYKKEGYEKLIVPDLKEGNCIVRNTTDPLKPVSVSTPIDKIICICTDELPEELSDAQKAEQVTARLRERNELGRTKNNRLYRAGKAILLKTAQDMGFPDKDDADISVTLDESYVLRLRLDDLLFHGYDLRLGNEVIQIFRDEVDSIMRNQGKGDCRQKALYGGMSEVLTLDSVDTIGWIVTKAMEENGR